MRDLVCRRAWIRALGLIVGPMLLVIAAGAWMPSAVLPAAASPSPGVGALSASPVGPVGLPGTPSPGCVAGADVAPGFSPNLPADWGGDTDPGFAPAPDPSGRGAGWAAVDPGFVVRFPPCTAPPPAMPAPEKEGDP